MATWETVYRALPPGLQTLALNAHAWRIDRHRYGAPYRHAVTRLREQERWSLERIRAYQVERLREMIRVASDRSSYYRERLAAAGINPSHIHHLSDVAKLPILAKETLRARPNDLLTARRPRSEWLQGHTSGTTGSPLGVWYDRQTAIMTNAVDRRLKIWAGMVDDDWIGLLLGRVVVPPEQHRPPFWRPNWIHRQVWFSSFHLGDENLPSYVQEIRRRGLRFLEGYPSTLFILANYLVRRGSTLPMRAVLTSSETLHATQRETIEAAFACPIFDFYGLAERVIFAGDCETHQGKHLAEEYGYAEVVDDEGRVVRDGRVGYLVGTSLHNSAMPLLRYRTGDMSAIMREPCACGRTSRRIQPVTTKAEDIIVTPDGRMISPSILTHPFKPLGQIVKSQILQERLDNLVVKIVPSAQFTAAEERALVAGLTQRLGLGVGIEIRLVDDIPLEPSGKYRWVISRVQHPCSLPWVDLAPGERVAPALRNR